MERFQLSCNDNGSIATGGGSRSGPPPAVAGSAPAMAALLSMFTERNTQHAH